LTYFAIEEEQIKSKDADFDFDVLDLHILPLACHELLERQHFLLVNVPSYRFAVKDETRGAILDPGR
jgi:hypothetical protein